MLTSHSRSAIRLRTSALELLEDRRVLTDIGGMLTSDTVLTMNDSPYSVVSHLVVPPDVRLTIQPGVTLQFATGTGVTVEGHLFAEGTPFQRLTFDRAGAGRWSGIEIRDTDADNRIAFADMIGGDAQGEAINVSHARLLLDNVVWTGTSGTILELEHPSLIVRNSHFPTSPNGSEIIHGEYIEADEYLIIESNVFENSDNGGDVIDILGADRPGPVMQILNNIFKGGGDDGLDLDGTDAHVEGNLFMGFHKNTSRSTTSNAIATGLPQSGEANRTQVTVVRNIFVDNDHAILLKEDAFGTIKHNVFVGMTEAAIQFNEVNGTAVRGPGMGALIDGNIFHDNASLFKNLVDNEVFTTQISVVRSLLPDETVDFDGTDVAAHSLGDGNLAADPMFVDAVHRDFRLHANSPAIGAAAFGLDMGAYVDTLAHIQEVHPDSATDNDIVFEVGGTSAQAYRYRVNDGAFGPLTSIDQPIELLDMANGDYSLEVVAMNSAGEWIYSTTPAFGEKSGHVIAPTATRTGELLPSIVRVYDHSGQIHSYFSTPTTLETSGIADASVKIKKGVGTLSAVVSATESFQLAVPDDLIGQSRVVEIPARSAKQIEVLDSSFPTVEYSGEVIGNVTWSADAEHHVTSDLMIPAGSSLTVEAGARILLSNQVNMRVEGELITLGTDAEPIVFNAADPANAWGGIRIANGSARFSYTFFTRGGGDTSQEFGHSDSQPVLRADGAELQCDNCFLINNIGKGFGASDDAVVTIHASIISNADTGGEFSNSLVTVTDSYVRDIPNDDGIFNDDDNDGFYFAGVHSSGQASRFVDSFVLNTKDDGLDHNGAQLIVERAWIEGTLHEGIASSNRNAATVIDSVIRHTNQGVEAGYGRPELTVRNSVIVDIDAQADPDSPINAGIRFGDGYDGSNGAYTGHISASEVVVWNSGDNVRNYDGSIPGPKENAIAISNSVTNDADFNGLHGNAAGVPVLSETMHLLRGSVGFAASDDGLPVGRILPATTMNFTIDSLLPSIWIDEVLANPGDGLSRYFELKNYGTETLSLSGLRVTDDLSVPDQLTLDAIEMPAGTIVNVPTSFLAPTGGTIYLLQSVELGGGVIDSMHYGNQLVGKSIGRDEAGRWQLNQPTPSGENTVSPTSDQSSVRINEWSPNSDPNDFVELFNTAELPVNIGLAYISANNETISFAPFSFVDKSSFTLIDGEASTGFGLDDGAGSIELIGANGGSIDLVRYQVAGSGMSQGRAPDGTGQTATLKVPTPGAANSDPIETTVISFQDGVSPDGYLGTEDTWLNGSDANTNLGSQDRMDSDSDSSGSAEWSLLRWDLTSIDDAGLVQSATISLTVNNASSDDQRIFAMKTGWKEDEATWNVSMTGQNWAAPGTGEADRGVLIGILSTGGRTGTYDVDLNVEGIAVVQSWLDDSSANFGVIILGGDDGVEIRTSEYSVRTQRPKLTIGLTERAVSGDFNHSGTVDEQDINLLCRALRAGENDSQFDLTGDGLLNADDRDELIVNVLGTTYGDANLDGIFNSTDFVAIFQRGEYEDSIIGNSQWSDGDWNCDGDFTTTDLVVAFQAGGYVNAAQRAESDNLLAAAVARRDVDGKSPSHFDGRAGSRPADSSAPPASRHSAVLAAGVVDSVFLS